MKLSGKEIAKYVFKWFYFDAEPNDDNKSAALKIADRLIDNRPYIELGLGDRDFLIEDVIQKAAGYGIVKVNAVGYSAKFFLDKEYEIDEEKFNNFKAKLYG